MELYLHLVPFSVNCEGLKHIRPVYDAIVPEINERSRTPCTDYRNRRETVFFSRKKVEQHFSASSTIEALLKCTCKDCVTSYNSGKYNNYDETFFQRKIMNAKDGPLFLALMVYLRTLHLVYPWLNSEYVGKDLRTAVTCLLDEFSSRFEPGLETRLFRDACRQALEMFTPVILDFSVKTRTTYSDMRIFPFFEEMQIRQGTFGTMSKFEIHRESLHESIKPHMVDYSSSATGCGNEKKILFAKKSVRTTSDGSFSIEHDMLRMVSEIEKPAAENIVTLLTCYIWRGYCHFVFPYIDIDLRCLLRDGRYRPHLSPFLQNNEALPDNWLWQEMVGISCALEAMHIGMRNPFDHLPGRVIAFHFDLKPANILVAANGKLKIADFGQSSIEIVNQGDTPTTAYRPGDQRYTAPESRNLKKINATLGRHQGDIEVLLNYDVWSLACIMTEVLVHILSQIKISGQAQGLDFLDKKVAAAQDQANRGRFFDDEGLKKDIKLLLDGIKFRFDEDLNHNQYMKDIGTLLLDMFEHDNSRRISSTTVHERLEQASFEYFERRNSGSDPLVLKMLQEGKPDGIGHREIGWVDARGEIQSFLSMEGITIERVERGERVVEGRRESNPFVNRCRIRLFDLRPSKTEKPSKFVIVWADENVGKINKIKVTLQNWRLTPTYLFQNISEPEDKFECIIFPKDLEDPAYIFGFQLVENAHEFQGTLIQKKILPKPTVCNANISLTIYREDVKTKFKSACVQFWASYTLRYYDPAGQNIAGLSPSPPEAETMTVFSKSQCLLQLSLKNINDKTFSRASGVHEDDVIVQGTPSSGFKYFSMTQTSHSEPWKNAQEQKSNMLLIPSIRLGTVAQNEDKNSGITQLKVEHLGIDLQDKIDLKKLFRGLEKQHWSKPKAGSRR